MNSKEATRLIRKAAGNGPNLSDGERESLKQHFTEESDALAEECRQRKLERQAAKRKAKS